MGGCRQAITQRSRDRAPAAHSGFPGLNQPVAQEGRGDVKVKERIRKEAREIYAPLPQARAGEGFEHRSSLP